MGFFGDLMGKTSANEARRLGQRNEGQINSGYDRADGYATEGYGAAQDRLAPFAGAGQRGFQAYGDAIGINGDDARRQAFGNFQSDPFTQYARQNSGNEVNALFKRYGAQGMANSGASGLAVSRAAGERATGDVNNWLNRLQGVGQQGLQIAGTQAGLDTSHFGGMADRAVGRSQALVSNDTQATQAANNAKMSGVNNLLSGLGTLGGSMFSAFSPKAGAAKGAAKGAADGGGPYSGMGGAYGGGF